MEYSTVAKYLRSTRFEERDMVQADSNDALDADLVDQEILQVLAF
jgi:uridine kinase